ncbi:Uncharacterised protein [Mycobacteroides abscessus subsp. abscessus]|nr:Uncharacterised protein [Mycobacteroides abscessus subsp. abscessus]
MAELKFYGASDDLVEFEGVIREEFDVYKPALFLLTITDGDDQAQFELSAKFWADWELSVGAKSHWSNIDVDVKFTAREDYDSDPMVVFDIPDGASVKVVRVGGD